MRKLLIALVLMTALCLGLAAVAAADPGNVQGSSQSATTSQAAGAASGATQIDPSNTNISIRVLSPGDDGSVSQSNTAGSSATAGNRAGTTQAADQGSGGSGIQTSTQGSTTDQLAGALSAAAQLGASNVNAPVRVLSPGSDGDVTQSNTAGSSASAGNAATAGQSATQDGGGSSCGCDGSGSGVQTSKQAAGTEQGAGALSTATQDHPSNTNVSIRVLSPGSDGDVTQANTAGSSATAGNAASTTQGATQSSGTSAPAPVLASGTSSTTTTAPASPAAAPVAPSTDQSNTAGSSAAAGNQAGTTQSSQQNGSANGIQVGDQSAVTGQLAGAYASAEQDHPSNTAGSVRVLSPGSDGNVAQSNTVGSSASAGNSASTSQSSTQGATGSCGCSGTPAIQVAGQQASTGQGALAASAAGQLGASNTATPVRVLSPGSGGDVTQSNTVGSSATAGNAATTGQSVGQQASGGCGCGIGSIQVAGQQAATDQGSAALSAAVQSFGGGERECGCGGSGGSGNEASPVRVWSPGSDGDVTQSNAVGSSATSGNRAGTSQTDTQSAGGSAIQVAGQKADTGQLSFAGSLAAQLGASNIASPVRVLSPGGGGDVTQSNTVGSSASAGNAAGSEQRGTQAAETPCGCGYPIQVLGQQVGTGQLAKGLSGALQLGAGNTSGPVRVASPDEYRELMPVT
jgi:GTP cyclohydrolase II